MYKRLAPFLTALALATATPLVATTSWAADPAPAAAVAPAAPAAAPAAEAPAAPKAGKEQVENPYGPGALWTGGDFVSKAVLIILVLMSLGTWYVMVTKFFEQYKLDKQAQAAADGFWSAGSVSQGAEALDQLSPFRFIAQSGIDATKKHGGLLGHINLNDWVSMSVDRSQSNVQNRLQDGLAFLATVGSTAPFVGLFGTVWGILNALTAIGVAGQASIDKVAGPVGEALYMTAIGLAVAVPAVLGYNWLVRRNKTCMEKVRAFSGDLHAVLLADGNLQGKG